MLSNHLPDAWQRLLESLYAENWKIALVAAGGGSRAISYCLHVPGASHTIVEAVIPYARSSTINYLGGGSNPPSFTSRDTAIALAQEASCRACQCCDDQFTGRHHVGIALVAALPTTTKACSVEPRIRVVVTMDSKLNYWSLEWEHNRFTRNEAERISDELLFSALATLTDNADNRHFFQENDLTVEFQSSSTY